MGEVKSCVICGARCGSTARTFPFITQRFADTCDQVCAEAKRNKLTRAAQLSQSIRNADREFNYDKPPACRPRSDTLDYNRDYLAADSA